jgi:hypothetical protein
MASPFREVPPSGIHRRPRLVQPLRGPNWEAGVCTVRSWLPFEQTVPRTLVGDKEPLDQEPLRLCTELWLAPAGPCSADHAAEFHLRHTQ